MARHESDHEFDGWLPVGDEDVKDEDTGRVTLEPLRNFIRDVCDECDDEDVVGISTGTHNVGKHGSSRIRNGSPSMGGTTH